MRRRCSPTGKRFPTAAGFPASCRDRGLRKRRHPSRRRRGGPFPSPGLRRGSPRDRDGVRECGGRAQNTIRLQLHWGFWGRALRLRGRRWFWPCPGEASARSPCRDCRCPVHAEGVMRIAGHRPRFAFCAALAWISRTFSLDWLFPSCADLAVRAVLTQRA